MYELKNYLRNPIYCSNEKPKLKAILFLFLVYVITIILIGIVIALITKEFHIKINEFKLSTHFKTILVGVIIVPFYEEILFRSLLKFKKANITLFIATIVVFIVIAAVNLKIKSIIFFSALLLGFLSMLFVFKRIRLESFLSSKFKFFFYASALLFGLLHAFNFSGNIYLILAFSPILGGPQIVLGLILGYIRMKNGLVYSILFHMIVNIFGFLI